MSPAVLRCTVGMATTALFLCTAGCGPRTSFPWTLLEIGDLPIGTALDSGQVVHAIHEGQENPFLGMLFPSDTALASRIARRDLRTLPMIACGDRMRLHPGDLPASITQQLGWSTEDSLTVSWHCLDATQMAALGRRAFSAGMDSADAERRWWGVLKRWKPETQHFTDRTYREGEQVNLTILTQLPDGRNVGDTVTLSFHFGDTDQVVKALEPGLFKAGPGAHWTVWSPSALAFGNPAHPSMGIPPFTPLHFSVTAH